MKRNELSKILLIYKCSYMHLSVYLKLRRNQQHEMNFKNFNFHMSLNQNLKMDDVHVARYVNINSSLAFWRLMKTQN